MKCVNPEEVYSGSFETVIGMQCPQFGVAATTSEEINEHIEFTS